MWWPGNMTTSRSRRSGLFLRTSAALMLAGLTGCGFHPLYQDSASQPEVTEEMKRIYVASIPDRFGQQMRLDLQQELAGDGPEDPDGYTLYVNPSQSYESIDIHSDNTSGRSRVVGRAHWRLFTIGQYPKLLAEGDASTMDGMNNTFEQYFAQSMNSETLQTRVAKALAEGVTQQIAIWFRTRAPTAKSQSHSQAYYPIPNAIPGSSTQQPVERAGDDGMPAMATGRLDPNSDTTNDDQP